MAVLSALVLLFILIGYIYRHNYNYRIIDSVFRAGECQGTLLQYSSAKNMIIDSIFLHQSEAGDKCEIYFYADKEYFRAVFNQNKRVNIYDSKDREIIEKRLYGDWSMGIVIASAWIVSLITGHVWSLSRATAGFLFAGIAFLFLMFLFTARRNMGLIKLNGIFRKFKKSDKKLLLVGILNECASLPGNRPSEKIINKFLSSGGEYEKIDYQETTYVVKVSAE